MIEAAWERSLELRCCPPLSVLVAGGDFVQHHLAICKNCQNRLELREPMHLLGERLAAIDVPLAEDTPVRAGDIRNIRPDGDPAAYFDEEGTYFNPPAVLVLDDGPDKSGLVRVAQLFDEKELAFDGDIRLDECDSTYAESWNIYGMHIKHLGMAAASVEPQVAAGILRLSDSPRSPVKVNSPLFMFRQCELATGSFFSIPSVMYALNAMEARQETISIESRRIPIIPTAMPSFEEYHYAAAAADSARRFEDKREKLSVRLYPGGRVEMESRSTRPMGVQLADAEGCILVRGYDRGRGLGLFTRKTGLENKALMDQASDDIASFVVLRPGVLVKVRLVGDRIPNRVLCLDLSGNK